MALEQMEGFDLAGRTVSSFLPSFSLALRRNQLRVNTVHEKGSVKYTTGDSLDENGGKGSLISASYSYQTKVS